MQTPSLQKIWITGFLALLLATIFTDGSEEKVNPQISRLLKVAVNLPDWQERNTLSDRMWKLRKTINLLPIVSDPVSDRYLITKLGGPIDLVHFLALSAQVSSEQYSLEQALFLQWKAEGGPNHEKGLSRIYYPEAHPDDLPSNAFGALFGSEVKKYQSDPNARLELLLTNYFKPLQPVGDAISKQYSHQYIVMGLPKNPSRSLMLSRSEWFSAKPIYLIPVLDPRLKTKVTNPDVALKSAGFEVYNIQNRPIGIRRIKVANE